MHLKQERGYPAFADGSLRLPKELDEASFYSQISRYKTPAAQK